MNHVVMFSGGGTSWLTAKRVVERHGPERVTLLFADTKMEDEDLYRFLAEAEENVGVPITRIADGRDPWQVFEDERMIGNTRVDPCSKILKRKLMRRWLEENRRPIDTVVYLGYGWQEIHRVEKAEHHWDPWHVEAPLFEPPLLEKEEILQLMEAQGIRRPRLYELGFEHNNCGGFCVKAGQAQFELLLRTMPDRYRYHERSEERLRKKWGKDVAILRDRRGGTTKPMTMRAFRERLEAQPSLFDNEDWGACSCLEDPDDA
jgi:3'-phosphoadenosine 5'-phosphosulfate sulfotransferase (PAPS reductase)/FAD synthetase